MKSTFFLLICAAYMGTNAFAVPLTQTQPTDEQPAPYYFGQKNSGTMPNSLEKRSLDKSTDAKTNNYGGLAFQGMGGMGNMYGTPPGSYPQMFKRELSGEQESDQGLNKRNDMPEEKNTELEKRAWDNKKSNTVTNISTGQCGGMGAYPRMYKRDFNDGESSTNELQKRFFDKSSQNSATSISTGGCAPMGGAVGGMGGAVGGMGGMYGAAYSGMPGMGMPGMGMPGMGMPGMGMMSGAYGGMGGMYGGAYGMNY